MRYVPVIRSIDPPLPEEIIACDECGSHAGVVRSYLLGRIGHPTRGNPVRIDLCLRCRLADGVHRAQRATIETWTDSRTFFPLVVQPISYPSIRVGAYRLETMDAVSPYPDAMTTNKAYGNVGEPES